MGLYLGGHHPIRSKGAYSQGRGLNETRKRFPERGVNGSPLRRGGREKPGRYESRRIEISPTPSSKRGNFPLCHKGGLRGIFPGSNGE